MLAGNASVQPLEDKPTYLCLERKGEQLLASISQDGKDCKQLKPLEVKLSAKLKLGVSCGGTSLDMFASRLDLC